MEETAVEEHVTAEVVENAPKKNWGRAILICVIAALVACGHYKYVSILFENDRNFSYLSELEREMSLRTEMGFYYSYYKTIVEERPFVAGISKLMYDKMVEYPQEVNALNRFNIHPEVLLGAIYRYFEPYLNTSSNVECLMVDRSAEHLPEVESCTGIGVPILFYLEAIWWLAGVALAAIFLHATLIRWIFEPYLNTSSNVECLMVDRSAEHLPEVESCTGIGVPILFYLEAIWWLAGVALAAVFLHATLISESILGGLMAVTHFFVNHAEATRVHWAPNERENFAWPLLLAQACLVSAQLRRRRAAHAFQLQVAIFFLNCTSLLFWQFTQFIFLTQIAIFFVMEQLRIIDMKAFCVFLHSHFCGLHTAVLLLQGNDMLKSSLYVSFFFSVSVYCLFFSALRVKVENTVDFFVEAWLVVLRISIVVCSSLYIKKLLNEFLNVQEDNHIWDLLYSKFTDYKNFHTMMYTCSEVFDFLPWKSVRKLLESFLLSIVIYSVMNVVIYWYKSACEVIDKKHDSENENATQDDEDSGIENTNTECKLRRRKSKSKDKEEEVEEKAESKEWLVLFVKNLQIEPHVFYGLAQMVVYGVMAALIMRLKLLFVTQLCIVSALIMNRKYFKYVAPLNRHPRLLPLLWLLLLIPIGMSLFKNVLQEMSYVGEFSDPPLEELLQWITRNTAGGASFAGSMPLMAAVLLSARRPVVLHPHYEHRPARERAYAVYKMYGRFTAQELYQELTALRSAYLVVERSYCYGRSNKNCTFDEIWNIEDPSLPSRRHPPLCRLLLNETADHFYPVFSNAQYRVLRVYDVSVRYMPRSFDT